MHLEKFIKEYKEAKKEIRQKGKKKLLKIQEDPYFFRRQWRVIVLGIGILSALIGHDLQSLLGLLVLLITFFTNKER